jgi:polyphosphate glucokinase
MFGKSNRRKLMEILGIDIGGSGIKGAIVDIENGQLTTERYRIPTPKPATPKAVTNAVVKLVKHFKWLGPIGCGFPAAISGGIVRTASNIHEGWIGTAVSTLFTEATTCPTVVLNDADAAGLAEMTFGAGKNQQGVVFIITVGTGIGTAAFSGGCLLPNMELGHLILNEKIAEHYVSDAVRKREELSWKKWSKRFNTYLAEIERLFWPDLIIIGGGVSKREEKFFKYLSSSIKIIPAQLLNEAGIIGAALAAKR